MLAVYSGRGQNSNYDALYACICIINNNEMSILKAPQKLYEDRNSINYIKLIKLENNKVLISFSNKGTRVIICEISDNTVTYGEVVQIVSTTSNYEHFIAKLTNTEIVILYTFYSERAIVACTINSLEVLVNTPLSVETGINYITLTAISNKQVMLTYETVGRLTAIIYSTSNSVIFAGTPVVLIESMWSNGAYKLISLSENKVLLCVIANNNLYGAVIFINQSKITIGEIITLIEGNAYRAEDRFSLELITVNTAITLYPRTSNLLHAAILKVDGSKISLERDIEILTNAPAYKAKAINMKENQMCIGYCTAGANAVFNLFTYSFNVIKEIQKLQNENSIILGVAQKKGSAGEIIPVIVPDFSIKEEN